MQRVVSISLGSILLACLFFVLVFINNMTLNSVRLDLTENQVYSLSDGSKAVIDELQEPINLYFFFSDTASTGMTGLRNYATRVESLLEEYANYANGKIRLHIIDPIPFSESEDQASQYGLTGAAIGQLGESVYFGLAGTNAVDDQQVISFFDPQKESFLEYDLSQLIYQLTDGSTVNVTLLTDLNVVGGQNPMTGQFEPEMVFHNQLGQLFELTSITSRDVEVPLDTEVLVIAHPQGLNDALLSSIEQYALNGGRLMIFADPHYESDPMALMGGVGANPSDLTLLSKWGVEIDANRIVLDANLGLEVRTPQGGIARHLGILGFDAQVIDERDVITANLDSINAASVGAITLTEDAQLSMTPLLTTSSESQLHETATYAVTQDPQEHGRNFKADNQTKIVAARLTGQANSDLANLNILLIADADFLADRFWVQQSNFFGQTIFTPFANNGDLIINAVENLAGSDALISVRSRGTFSRPFERVEALEVVAEAKFRAQEERLQQQLAETEAQLAQLQSQQGEGGALVVTDEQQLAIDEFVEQRIAIRKELRDVRFQLDRDIDELGNWLKFINVAVAPLILSLVLYLLAALLRASAARRSIRKVVG